MAYSKYTNDNRPNSFQPYNYYYKADKPSFVINGYEFHLAKNATAEGELNIVENNIYTPNSMYGYKDVQFNNFTGEVFDCVIYSRTTEVYTGEHAQPEKENMGIADFYNTDRTPHAVLKYWADNFVPCKLVTNLQAYNNGTYIIKSIKQENLELDFVQTTLTMIYYYKVRENYTQVYWSPWSAGQFNNARTINLSATAQRVMELGYYSQMCGCTSDTPHTECESVGDPEVAFIQQLLQDWGYFPRYTDKTKTITPNGVYCFQTTQAIKKFQEKEGIPVSGNFTEETKHKFLKKVIEG